MSRLRWCKRRVFNTISILWGGFKGGRERGNTRPPLPSAYSPEHIFWQNGDLSLGFPDPSDLVWHSTMLLQARLSNIIPGKQFIVPAVELYYLFSTLERGSISSNVSHNTVSKEHHLCSLYWTGRAAPKSQFIGNTKTPGVGPTFT